MIHPPGGWIRIYPRKYPMSEPFTTTTPAQNYLTTILTETGYSFLKIKSVTLNNKL